MDKLDLKKLHKPLYSPSTKTIEFVDVPEILYLMLDGSGDPDHAPAFPDSVAALNTAAYALKFALKKQGVVDFTVMPTEGQWWVENLAELDFDDKSNWLWTLMIAVPDAVTHEAFEQVIAETRKKKDVPLLETARLERYAEGRVAQILYIGSYADELPTVDRMHENIWAQGYQLRGKHHEIYLSDPRRTPPEKLKTILRQPVTNP